MGRYQTFVDASRYLARRKKRLQCRHPIPAAFVLLVLSLGSCSEQQKQQAAVRPAVAEKTTAPVVHAAGPAPDSATTPTVVGESVFGPQEQPPTSATALVSAPQDGPTDDMAQRVDEEFARRMEELQSGYQKKVRELRSLIEATQDSEQDQQGSDGIPEERGAGSMDERPEPRAESQAKPTSQTEPPIARRLPGSKPLVHQETDESSTGAPTAPAAGPSRPPELTKPPVLRYPKRARRLNRQAVVVVLVQVDEQGRVVESVLEEGQSLGYGFEAAALAAAPTALYSPALENGRPITAWTRLTLSYKLR